MWSGALVEDRALNGRGTQRKGSRENTGDNMKQEFRFVGKMRESPCDDLCILSKL